MCVECSFWQLGMQIVSSLVHIVWASYRFLLLFNSPAFFFFLTLIDIPNFAVIQFQSHHSLGGTVIFSELFLSLI